MSYQTTFSGAQVWLTNTVTGMTGDGTDIVVPFNSIQYNPLNEATDTGTFIPVFTGIYNIQLAITLTGIVLANTSCGIYLAHSGQLLFNLGYFNPYNYADATGQLTLNISQSAILTASTSYYIALVASGSMTKNVNILSGTVPVETYISWTLVQQGQ